MAQSKSRAGVAPADSSFDVVVVGFGGAGSAAALEAARVGARVLVVDRFGGGGATKMCAGIVYMGGGTDQQRRAGFADTPEAMEAYLRTETAGAVDDDTVREFCRQSLPNYEWLRSHGVGFPDEFYAPKTTVPGDRYGLYYSGNEQQRADAAPPAPRGHRVAGEGLTGKNLYAALSASVLAAGVAVWRHAEAVRLLTDGAGRVDGIELRVIDRKWARARHTALAKSYAALASGGMPGAKRALRALRSFEERNGRIVTVRARSVVLSSGGFVFSPELMERHAGPYRDVAPLGTAGDDGAALRLGTAVGAATDQLDRFAASRFICPPDAFVCGVLVNPAGERICDETLYGASLSAGIAEKGAGEAYLVIDHALWRRAHEEMQDEERLRDLSMRAVLTGGQNHVVFRKGTAWLNRHVNRKRAPTLASLGRAAGIDPAGLAATVRAYNDDAAAGRPDRHGKAEKYVSPLLTPPYYAIDASLGSKLFPAPCLSLGGLQVDGTTGAVRSADGDTIPGLYAAGRAAVGVSSRSYVSGLSIADSLFSGRNAGQAAAQAATSSPV